MLMRILSDETGSQKSIMTVSKPKRLIWVLEQNGTQLFDVWISGKSKMAAINRIRHAQAYLSACTPDSKEVPTATLG